MTSVLMVSRDDWANIGYVFQESLRAAGVEALAITEKPHGFDYPIQAKQVDPSRWPHYFDKADVIINMHSMNCSGPLPDKHICVFYGGASYRRSPSAFTALFNPFVDCSIIQTGDLLGYGAKNEAWLLPAVDLNTIKPRFGIWGRRLKIGHYPRSWPEKGGPAVESVIKRLQKKGFEFDFLSSKERVSWAASIERMSECDIYVEALAPTHLGRKHGAWGVTALEAAALGKVVVTNFADLKLYEQIYGKCALQVANTELELEAALTRILETSRYDLENLQVDSREWVERYHSYHAVGQRLEAIIEHYCFGKPAVFHKLAPDATEVTLYDPKSYWESRGHAHTLMGEVTREELFQLVSWIAELRLSDKAIVEVGSGQGTTYNFLKTAGVRFTNYKMIDFAQSCRYKCRQMTGVLPDGWNGVTLPYNEGSAELVIATDVLLHVPDRDIEPFVAEMSRVSSRFIVVSSYCGENGMRSEDLAFHLFIHNYEELWKANGLKVRRKLATDRGRRAVWLLEKTS